MIPWYYWRMTLKWRTVTVYEEGREWWQLLVKRKKESHWYHYPIIDRTMQLVTILLIWLEGREAQWPYYYTERYSTILMMMTIVVEDTWWRRMKAWKRIMKIWLEMKGVKKWKYDREDMRNIWKKANQYNVVWCHVLMVKNMKKETNHVKWYMMRG